MGASNDVMLPGPLKGVAPLTVEEKEIIIEDMYCRIHGPVGGFLGKYFLGVDSDRDGLQNGNGDLPSSDSFLPWLSGHLSKGNQDPEALGRWGMSCVSNAAPEDASDADIFLLRSSSSDTNDCNQSANTQVIGQYTRDISPNGYKMGLFRLCRQARNVFATQPTRYQLHAFYIFGMSLELWVFDRSGMYSSPVIDIQTEFHRFLFVMRYYSLLDDEELGVAEFIKEDKDGQFISNHDGPKDGFQKLYLDRKPIAASENLFGPGTACYRARLPDSTRWDYVVKFKWRGKSDGKEEDILGKIKEENVWGVTSLDYHEYLTRTSYLRGGLRYHAYKKLLEDVEINEITSREGIAKNSEGTERSFEDLMLTCVVTSPVGKPLKSFSDQNELLFALRDGIKAHRSLFQDAAILHQDISTGNILITDGPGKDSAKGFLIDLDVAVQLNIGKQAPREITGTPAYMAIEVLRGKRHTYRHDLESFFYVFLWLLVSNGRDEPPETSRLQEWEEGTFEQMAFQKTIDMREEGFDSILAEFPAEFESLKETATALREIFFPSQADGAIWTGTDGSTDGINKMYDGIIRAFDKAISHAKKLA